ncbi:MAG: hypothetical protein CM15mP83_4310 [Flavobacteriaceae bacterium]|nr:MAG: hypothetical protein CM15mP83_4310 [Flavobacteriaceae bacterium]
MTITGHNFEVSPRYFSIVFALAGDSTITRFLPYVGVKMGTKVVELFLNMQNFFLKRSIFVEIYHDSLIKIV